MVSDTVRHLFPQLLKNGYVPIPNRDKACYLKNWTSIEVDERQAMSWSRQMRWPAIGLRVEPPLLVLDYDLPDITIANAVRAITPAVILEGALERVGNPPKTAFFLRMRESDPPFHKLCTRRYTFAGQTKPVFAAEAYAGGGGGKQIGSFGPHSHDEHGRVLKTYQWLTESPAELPLWELPEMTRAEVAAHLDAVDALLAGWPGLYVDPLSQSGETFQSQAYDLKDETVFVDAEGFEYLLPELIAEAKARKELGHPQLRVTGSFTGDPTSSGSARCKVHWSKRDGVSIVDFKTGITHHPAGGEDDIEVQRLLGSIFTKGYPK